LLARKFEEQGVKYIFRDAWAFASIEELFSDLAEAVRNRALLAKERGDPLYVPLLHLSCHGNSSGIVWTDGTQVPWRRLAEVLWSYSRRVDWKTSPERNGAFAQTTSLVSLELSCCYGAEAAATFFESEPYPVGSVIAPSDQIYIQDCADFFLELAERTSANPWNVPATVEDILQSRALLGPNGPVSVVCSNAPLSPNPNWKTREQLAEECKSAAAKPLVGLWVRDFPRK
jgi:hypothetical protein